MILTFSEWAFSVLGITGYSYTTNYGAFEKQRVSYEYAKLRALRTGKLPPYEKNMFAYLQKVYASYFGDEEKQIFAWQKREMILDRFDLSVLLVAYQTEFEQFVIKKEHFVESASGSYSKKRVSVPVSYNLMIVDEFQNYLPEQLGVLQSCINPRLQSMVYV